MKIKFLSALFALSIHTFSLHAQHFKGAEADRLVSGSEQVRTIGTSATPDFVKLREAAQFPASKFPKWVKKAYRLADGIELQLTETKTDRTGQQHLRYEVRKNGVPVFGAFYYAHTENDMVRSMNGKMPKELPTLQPTVAEALALEAAKQHIGAEVYKWELPEEEAHLKWETGDPNATYFPKGELVYINPEFDFTKPTAFRLAYRFSIYAHQPVDRADVFVDAQTGEVLFRNGHICHADVVGTAQTGYVGTKTIITDSFGGSFRLREAGRGNGIRTFDMNEGMDYGSAVDFTDANNVWSNVNAQLDQYATDAHWGAEMTYDYFLNEHGRNSIDDANMQINSYVHYDVDYFNAFWDGQRMTYGDGNNSPLTALDICGHEMTHGVTEFTAGLIYQDEYGALNESFSDVFGAAVEFVANPSSGDWLMGEDVGTFRSMSNPNAFGDPDTYNGTNWYTGTGDNGGVHINSGVQNKWFYILVQGETGTNDLGNPFSVTGIGLADAAAIAYRNLTVYLGPTSEYADARFYAIQSAIDLFGGCSPQVIATANAWYAVGVGGPFDPTVVSDFTASITSACQAPFTVEFTNLSNNGASYQWNFGDGGTSTAVNPSHTYTANGTYTVTLFTDGDNCGTDNEVRTNYISVTPNNPCTALMPNNGNQTLTWCTGTLYDDGGPTGNYQDNDNVITTISPPGATSVTLNFSSFNYEADYDYIYIYNGPTTASPLIGQYDGTGLPNGGTVSSTGGSITIRQSSDINLNFSGFALTWQCAQPNSPPSAMFGASPQVSCSGGVSFSDQSINGATGWLWNFGDGNTSTAQNPTHTYANEGTYTVVLTASNGFGSDVVSFNNYITVDRPDGPSVSGDLRCDAGTLGLSANGSGLVWYDQPAGGSQVGTGSTFNTPSLSSTTTYYVENVDPPSIYNVGPASNAIGGGGNFTGDQYLIFDCINAFTLNTVKVYAQGAGNRTIQLRNSLGVVLQSATVNIPNGEQTVTLNFSVVPGTGYQLGTTTNPNLYRNNAGTNYPYSVADVVTIQTSSAGNDYYYHFYNWEVETPGCTSERTAVVAEIVGAPNVQAASRCGAGSVSLSASGSGDLVWYDAALGGNVVNSGTTFNTPSISTTTSYFVESEIAPAAVYGGPATNAFGTGGNFNNVQSLVFDCYTPVTLVSVKVYAQGAGNRTIQLRNSGGTVLQSATVNIPNGESRVTLNFPVPVGTALQLGTSAAPNLYRNNTGPSYPYDIAGLVSITTSTAGTDFYYFFYDWEVQGEGCTTARTEVVATVEPNPTVSVSGNSSVCAGQSVLLSATATDADSYLWSPGGQTSASITVNPNSETTYSVTVFNTCDDATDQITVAVDPLPTVLASADADICDGESVQLSATGIGQLEWQPGGQTTSAITVNPTTTTIYSVSSTNNCGTVAEDVAVTVNELPVANAGQDVEICAGENVILTAIGGDDYSWSTGDQTASISVGPSSTETYTVEVTNADNCSASGSVTVTVNQLPAQPAITLNGSELESTSGADYQWYLDGNPITDATGATYAPMSSGNYTVEVFDINGCSSVSEPFNWITVGIDEFTYTLQVYPNPFSDEVRIISSVAIGQIDVTDAEGRTVFSKYVADKQLVLSPEDWSKGVYTLSISNENAKMIRKLVYF